MTHEREEKDRQARAKARAQMGSLLGRKPQALVAYCVCGARVASVQEVVLCNHEAAKGE